MASHDKYFAQHVVLAVILVAAVVAPAAKAENTSFIVRDGTLLKVQDTGRPWFYCGTNNYYVGIDNASQAVADEIVADMTAIGLNVIRIWGFNDDQGKATKLQGPNAGDWIEANHLMLDYFLARCNENDIRVILPLTNYWNDYGGMQQYVNWNSGGGVETFYTSAGAQVDHYNYISHLANRVNTVNGRVYKDDPTILAWQLANEPRNWSDGNVGNGSQMTNWISNTAAYMKNTVGVQQMISIGMEGFYDTNNAGRGGQSWMDGAGTGFLIQHALGDIDLAGFHTYQDHWSLSDANTIKWIRNHIRDARRSPTVGKPVIMDEYGRAVPPNSMATRDASYRNFLEVCNRDLANGTNFWILYHDAYPDYDSFGVYYPGDASTVAVIQNHCKKIALLNRTGIHQLHAFQYDTEDYQNDSYGERATINGITRESTPSFVLTGDGALCVDVDMLGEGPAGEASKFLVNAREGIFEMHGNPWGTGLDISDYGYQNLVARVRVDGMSGPGDLEATLYVKTGSGWTYDDGGGSGWTTLQEGRWVELVLPMAGLSGADLTDLRGIGLQVRAAAPFSGQVYLDFIGGDLTDLTDNYPYYEMPDDMVDLMVGDYGSGVVSSVDTSPPDGAIFTIDGPASGTSWWNVGLAWVDADLYPPTLDLSGYEGAAITVTNLGDDMFAKMFINYGWDHTGGNRTVETSWTYLLAGETRTYCMDFATYNIDRPEEIVKLGLQLGMNGPDGGYPAGDRMVVKISTEPSGVLPPVIEATVQYDWVYQNTPLAISNGGHKARLQVTVLDLGGNSSVGLTVSKVPGSGSGEVTVEDDPLGDPLVKYVYGSMRTDGFAGAGSLTLEVKATGDVGGEDTVELPLKVRKLGDLDDNGGVEPGDVSALVMKMNGSPPGSYDPRSFDLDANGGAEPGDLSIVINILNGIPVP